MNSDPNITIAVEPNNLSIEELQEQYLKISKIYLGIKKTNDGYMQEIYELKRSLNTANSTERFLTQELDSLQLTHKDDLDRLNENHSGQLLETKHRNYDLSNLNSQLELKVEELEVKVEKLEQELMERNEVSVEVSTTQFDQKEIEWEKKTSDLTELCTELNKRIDEYQGKIYKLESENSCLKERLECAEDNFYSKKEEVQEKDTVIDGLHEKLIEITAELNEIKNCPPDQRKKGNSLFAEVDDQRQLMKNILARQKNEYMQMQKQFSEREYEIRRLKQENAAIHKEMEICSTIFTKADTNYRNELHTRIKGLTDEKMHLEEKLKMYEKLLSDMSSNKMMNWVDTLMAYCKNETNDMKNKYHNCLLEKSFLDENYLKSQQTLAKWRFEAIKSRCIIMDRENKLTEHKIPFYPVNYTAQESELQKAVPIVSFSTVALKQEETIKLDNTENTSNQTKLDMSEIQMGNNAQLDLSDAPLSPQLPIKSEKMDTSEDYSLSESSSRETVTPPNMSPPAAADNKNFSIFCDTIVDETLQSDSTIRVEMDRSQVLPPDTNEIYLQENIKTEPIKTEDSNEININKKKKNKLVIRKVFIKSKK